jgi:DNA-binding transcriptional LysR family regulator
MVELRHLRYFIAVAEELNFSRAAERLHMAQPPLSAAIRQLERELGVDLFTRTTREVTLTEAGRAFLEGARRTLADADRAAQDAKRAGSGELGRLRIAYSWSTRFETLPALGRAFRASHPGVEFLGQEMWNARMPPAFESGSIDLALSVCPEIAAELELAPIRKERLVALLPEAHPLAGEEAIPLSSLADEEFVLFPRDIAPRLHDTFVAVYRHAGFEPRLRNESFHTGWDLGVLADIPAVAMAPQTVAGGLPSGIRAVALSEPTDSLETCLVWRTDERSPAVAEFVDVARAAFGRRTGTSPGTGAV